MVRKTANFKQLLTYLNKPEKTGMVILHNLSSSQNNVKQINKEFIDNFSYLNDRKNGNIMYHEIISFAEADKDKITPEIMEDIGRKYLQMRAGEALAYGKAHLDTKCPHLHVMISANLIGSSKKLWFSKMQFMTIRKNLEKYQRERYPNLTHSLVFKEDHKHDRSRTTETRAKVKIHEQERNKRLARQGKQKPSEKEAVKEKIKDCLLAALSEKDFADKLETRGLTVYKRGNTIGVKDLTNGTKYRLGTLDLADSYEKTLARWSKMPKRCREIEKIQHGKAKALWQDMEFKEDMLDALDGKDQGPQSLAVEQKRNLELKKVMAARRQRRRDDLGKSLDL